MREGDIINEFNFIYRLIMGQNIFENGEVSIRMKNEKLCFIGHNSKAEKELKRIINNVASKDIMSEEKIIIELQEEK